MLHPHWILPLLLLYVPSLYNATRVAGVLKCLVLPAVLAVDLYVLNTHGYLCSGNSAFKHNFFMSEILILAFRSEFPSYQ